MELSLPLLIGLSAGLAAYILISKSSVDWTRAGSPAHRVIDIAFIILIPVGIVVYGALNLGKYESFNLYGTDFALFDQVIWNTSLGRPLANSIITDAPFLLAQRFSPILFAFAPLYALHADPRILVLTPALAIMLAAIPLYWLARRRLGSLLAWVVTLAFITAPGLQYIALSHFKEIILTIPSLMLATVFLLQRKYLPFFVCTIIAMMCKEEVGLVAAAFGVYIFVVQRRYWLGGALAVGGVAWVIFLLQIVIPFFQGSSTYYYFGAGQYSATGLYDYLGSSVSDIVTNALLHPDLVIRNVLTPEKINILSQVLWPLGVIALLGADALFLALPTLGYTLLSNRQGQFIFGSEHYAPVYVFLFIGLVIGLERIIAWQGTLFHGSASRTTAARFALSAFVLTLSLSNDYSYGLIPSSKNFDANLYTPSAHDRLGEKLAAEIPQAAVVATQSELASHVAQRRYLYLDFTAPCWSALDYVFVDATRPWFGYRKEGWQELLDSHWFDTVVEQDGYLLARRSDLKLEDQLNIGFEDGLGLVGYSLPVTSTVIGGQTLHLLTGWLIEHQVREPYSLDITVEDAQGHAWAESNQEPCGGTRETLGWLPGRLNYDDTFLRLPPTIPSGQYSIRLGVNRRSDGSLLHVRNSAGLDLGTGIELAKISVVKNNQSFTANELFIERPLFVDIGEMRLLGSKPFPDKIRPGDPLQLGLYWRARSKPLGDYLVSVQLQDGDQRVLVDHTLRPANDTYPTTEWNAGEVLLDWHDLAIPQDATAGAYQIVVALKDARDQHSLGRASLGEIQVEP